MCRIARQLNLSSVTVLRKGVGSLFISLKLRSAVHVDTGYVNKVMRARIEIGVGLVKSLNQGNQGLYLWLHIRIHFTPLNQ